MAPKLRGGRSPSGTVVPRACLSGSWKARGGSRRLQCAGRQDSRIGANEAAVARGFRHSAESCRRIQSSVQPNCVGRKSSGDTPSSSPSSPSFLERVRDLQSKLVSAGLPALISYGLMNTLYYVVAFSISYWSYGALGGQPSQTPGLRGQYRHALVIFSLVWAGSQVTKLLRLSVALVLAPTTAKILDLVQAKLGLRSQGQAAVVVTLLCLFFAFTAFSASVLIKSAAPI